MTTTIAMIGGNVGPTAVWFSTENAYLDAFTDLGCTVIPVVQGELHRLSPTEAYDEIIKRCGGVPDLVTYTRTHNNTALGKEHTTTWRLLEEQGAKTASIHLDVFWGLPERISWMQNGDPMFTTQTVFTADGGSEKHWGELHINHVWLPPGFDQRRVLPKTPPRLELDEKIVFVGSEGYHKSWSHRPEMVAHLNKTYGARFVQFGGGSPFGTIRGDDLNAVYASNAIVVGDFCFAGQRANYWSDRVPETLGRGAFLLVTHTPGIEEWYTPGVHLDYWTARDFSTLDERIAHWTAEKNLRAMVALDGRALAETRDTYVHRARTVLEHLGVACVE